MSINQVSIKYARALCAVAKEQSKLEVIEQELDGFAELLKSNAELSAVFYNPGISASSKGRTFDALFAKNYSQIFVSFLKVVADKRREDCLVEIIRLYKVYANEERKIIIGQLITATKLHDAAMERLAAKITALSGKSAVIEQVVDANVMGGFALRFDDICYDGTIKRRLENIRSLLSSK